MRYLTTLSDYLRGIQDNPDWMYIYDLLLQLDVNNDFIEEIENYKKAEQNGVSSLILMDEWEYDSRWWYASKNESIKSELNQRYGLRLNDQIKSCEKSEDILDGQISLEEYIFSLNPVFEISRPDLIRVHP